MIKKTFACFASLFLVLNADAQYYEASQDTSLRVNHSLGAIVTAPLIVFMGGSPSNVRANLAYRRETGKGKNFRLTAVYDEKQVDYDDGLLSTITNLDDTTITYDYRVDRNQAVSLRAGWEWSSPRKAVAPYYLVDAIIGAGIDRERRGDALYYRDSTITEVRPDFSRVNQLNLTADYTRVSYFAGVGLTLGWRVDLGENWMLTAQSSMEFMVSPYQKYTYNIPPVRDVPRGATNFDFNWRLIDVSIFYRF